MCAAMIFKEYGKDRKDTIILLHGGGLSWWNYRDQAEQLSSAYHVILPVLDGHAGSDAHFTSIEDNASKIIAWIDENCGGQAVLIGGLSLGGQVLLEMLAQRPDVCRYALAESAAVIADKLTGALVGPAFGSSYGLIKNRQFARLQFRSLHIRDELFEAYYRDTCAIEKQDMTAFMKASTSYVLKDSIRSVQAKVHIVIGERENRIIQQSAEKIHTSVSGSTLQIIPDLYHGEFSLNHPDMYVQKVNEIITDQKK